MKRLLFSCIVICFSVLHLSAQKPAFEKGFKVLNMGLGLGSSVYTESYYHLQFPLLSAAFEVGIVDHVLERGIIGVGGYAGYYAYRYEYSKSGWNSSNIVIGARGNFHYPLLEKLDTYTGLMLGYEVVGTEKFGTTDIDYNLPSSGIEWAWFVGGRYYFSEIFSALLELGYGITYLNLGVAIKF
jgi:hypothetical protein